MNAGNGESAAEREWIYCSEHNNIIKNMNSRVMNSKRCSQIYKVTFPVDLVTTMSCRTIVDNV